MRNLNENKIMYRGVELGYVSKYGTHFYIEMDYNLMNHLDCYNKRFNTIYQADKWLEKNKKYLYYAYIDAINE